jgi:hypothetical protein
LAISSSTHYPLAQVNDPKNFEALHTTLTHHLPAAMALKPSEAAAAQLEGPLAEYEEQHLQEEQREQERADGMYTDSLIKTPARSAGEAEQPEAPATFRGKVRRQCSAGHTRARR